MDVVPVTRPRPTESRRLPGAALAPAAGMAVPGENAIIPCVSHLPRAAKARATLCCREPGSVTRSAWGQLSGNQ